MWKTGIFGDLVSNSGTPDFFGCDGQRARRNIPLSKIHCFEAAFATWFGGDAVRLRCALIACVISGSVDFVIDVGQGGDQGNTISKHVSAVCASVLQRRRFRFRFR
jgi:hypothetical protein